MLLIAFILIAWLGLSHCGSGVAIRNVLAWVVFVLAVVWWVVIFLGHPLVIGAP
jgi:hypothetical protein